MIIAESLCCMPCWSADWLVSEVAPQMTCSPYAAACLELRTSAPGQRISQVQQTWPHHVLLCRKIQGSVCQGSTSHGNCTLAMCSPLSLPIRMTNDPKDHLVSHGSLRCTRAKTGNVDGKKLALHNVSSEVARAGLGFLQLVFPQSLQCYRRDTI